MGLSRSSDERTTRLLNPRQEMWSLLSSKKKNQIKNKKLHEIFCRDYYFFIFFLNNRKVPFRMQSWHSTWQNWFSKSCHISRRITLFEKILFSTVRLYVIGQIDFLVNHSSQTGLVAEKDEGMVIKLLQICVTGRFDATGHCTSNHKLTLLGNLGKSSNYSSV